MLCLFSIGCFRLEFTPLYSLFLGIKSIDILIYFFFCGIMLTIYPCLLVTLLVMYDQNSVTSLHGSKETCLSLKYRVDDTITVGCVLD